MKKEENRLYEVDIARIVLIFLLVLYHSFVIYDKQWEFITIQPDIPTYKWLSIFFYSFFLEMFVFISGYVYGHKMKTKVEIDYKKEILNKVKRLLLPCWLFSVLYYILFGDLSAPWTSIALSVFYGCGHLWFLPMLFLCFLAVLFIERVKMKQETALSMALFFSLLSSVRLLYNIPFHLGSCMYFFFFFYLGYIIKKTSCDIFEKFSSIRTFLWLVAIFFLVFIAISVFETAKLKTSRIVLSLSQSFVSNLGRLFSAGMGVMVVFVYAYWRKTKIKGAVPQIIKLLPKYCFGIYIYQQFVLLILYSFLPEYLSYEILPWVGFVIAFILSYLLTRVTLCVPFLKSLIG